VCIEGILDNVLQWWRAVGQKKRKDHTAEDETVRLHSGASGGRRGRVFILTHGSPFSNRRNPNYFFVFTNYSPFPLSLSNCPSICQTFPSCTTTNNNNFTTDYRCNFRLALVSALTIFARLLFRFGADKCGITQLTNVASTSFRHRAPPTISFYHHHQQQQPYYRSPLTPTTSTIAHN